METTENTKYIKIEVIILFPDILLCGLCALRGAQHRRD